MELKLPKNCGNSPKSELVKNLTVHFAAYELNQVFQFLDDNISWTLVGNTPISGKAAFKSALENMSGNKVAKLTINGIVTHGKEAAVHGEMTMEDGGVFGFADFYGFTSAKGIKVKAITSYVIQKTQN
ncbi:nuclear transport factor 2 family protein [Flagellimonas marinaquae]|uniref:nuclear transport factor 2 family protein n=1 Tax=Flagellimonas marinaquae TaxID=254955 RepID=UPI000F8D6E72|nr:nuclear transport factor 2 family protein [Allomuricauda aquimarina]